MRFHLESRQKPSLGSINKRCIQQSGEIPPEILQVLTFLIYEIEYEFIFVMQVSVPGGMLV